MAVLAAAVAACSGGGEVGVGFAGSEGGTSASAEFVFVGEDRPRAVVVTAAHPTPVAAFAVETLVSHVEKSTGVKLEVFRESERVPADAARRVYVGDTQTARDRGIDVAELPEHGFLLRAVGDDLFVLGRERRENDPLGRHSLTGTHDGVVELLDRYLGVRWLWPGEFGTYVPRGERFAVPGDLDEIVEPAFAFRRFRHGRPGRFLRDYYGPKMERLGVSRAWLERYAEALPRFVRGYHRTGYAEDKPKVGHKFSGWWERYGDEHPEWFMLNADGERGPRDGEGTKHVPMNVANPDLHDFILEEDWDGGDILRLGEVDDKDADRSPESRAWDGPQPETPPPFAAPLWDPFMVSDRYARFWKTIADRAAERNPDVLVTTFLYFNYLPAPERDIELGDNVYGEFVPWGAPEITYFPLREKAFAWLKEQWLGWADTGMRMAYRPNHLHGSYAAPLFSTWQAGGFFQFAHEHGMEGFDFDSLIGNWATTGPMLYMYMRLGVKPEMSVEAIRGEYFSGFGPAAEEVEAYFDYWEEYNEQRKMLPLYNPVAVNEVFPPDVFPPAETLLDEALAAAEEASRPEFAERVRFLQAGLEHALLAVAFHEALGHRGKLPEDPEQLREARRALKELVAFRRANDHWFITDFPDHAFRENRRLDIEALLGE